MTDTDARLIERLRHMANTHHAIKDCEAMSLGADRIESLTAKVARLCETGVYALCELDCLAARIYHDDQRQEVQAFADAFRAALGDSE
jgi:hypothetical protein